MTGFGLYLHIPFCARKCAYCDFPSWEGRMKDREAYADRLIEEMSDLQSEGPWPVAQSVFMGGGTPSLLAPETLSRLMAQLKACFQMASQAEISCELNPGTLSPAFMAALAQNGFNRLSLGMQSSLERELKLLGRRHRPQQLSEACALAREYGFTNFNLDLMMGIPGQTAGSLRTSLEEALRMRPTHLSLYSLIVEEGTPFEKLREKGLLDLPDEEAERDWYWESALFLEKEGFNHYEISNFARPGFECRHNLACWRREDYLGMGVAAHSLIGGRLRRYNPRELDDYLRGEPAKTESLSDRDAMFETLMLGLRLKEGVAQERFKERFGLSLSQAYPEALEKHLKDGLLLWQGGRLTLSSRGWDLMDLALLDFIP